MIMVVAAVYDSKVGAYLPPFFVVNQAVAQRSFADIVKHPDHQIARNPTDYSLFIIGSYNDETAEIRMFPQHINLGLAASYLKDTVTYPQQLPGYPPQTPEEVIAHVPEIAKQAVSNAARVLKGAAGGNSEKHVRPEPRPQDDV